MNNDILNVIHNTTISPYELRYTTEKINTPFKKNNTNSNTSKETKTEYIKNLNDYISYGAINTDDY